MGPSKIKDKYHACLQKLLKLKTLVTEIEGKISEEITENYWSRTSLSYSSKFAWKFLSFAHFLKTFFQYSVLFLVFSFSLLSFNSSIYSSSTISKRDTIVTENFWQQLLDSISCC